MAKAVKMADIAAILNVSTVTVSKALSNQRGVSEEMREKIKKLALEMGYKSPSEAKITKSKKSFHIGVLISEIYFDQHQSFYWQVYQEVATKAVAKECFTMLEILSSADEQKIEMPKLLWEDKVDGLIIIGTLREEYLSELKQHCTVPLVCLDFYDKRQECDAVITDNFYGMYKLTNYLFDMGHTQIGYVGTLLYTSSITDRYFGYCKALLEHGQKVREDWVINDRSAKESEGSEEFCYQLPKEMPTAFVCNCDLSAGALINFLWEKGYKVPEDISVVGFDNHIYSGICNVNITTYEVDIKEMARRTLKNLISKMKGEYYKQGLSIVEGHMVIKDSVKQIRKE